MADSGAASLTDALAHLVAHEELDDAEIDAALGFIFEGNAGEAQIAAFLIALRSKGETVGELGAIVRTMLRFATPVRVAPGAIDTCGTGGDRAGTFNVSTLAAVIAAAAGAKVVKHGNRASSSRCGSADVLEALGLPITLGPDSVARCVAETGIGFCIATHYHPSMRFLGPVRRALGVPTTFNFLGPLANPAHVTRQCVGVSDRAMADRMIQVLVDNGAERVSVFCGADGLDELTTTTFSYVHEYTDGERRAYELDPEALGLTIVEPAALVGGDAATNARIVDDVLDGKPGAAREIAALNAAAAIRVAAIADDFPGALELAFAALDDGRARATLEQWRAVATECARTEEA